MPARIEISLTPAVAVSSEVHGSVLEELKAAETMAAEGTSAVSCPDLAFSKAAVVQVYAITDDLYFNVGDTPAADAEPRHYVPAGGTKKVAIQPGQKVAWEVVA